MNRVRYEPPKQSKVGMIVDSLFLLGLVYVALLLPLLLEVNGNAGPATQEAAETRPAPTWESLGQNAVMQQQWEKLDVSVEDAQAIIDDKFDYTINPLSLIALIVVIVGYFTFLLRVSDREYREVISEKFDS